MEKGEMEEGFSVLPWVSPCGASPFLIGEKNRDCTALSTFLHGHLLPNSAVCDIMNSPGTYADLDNTNGILQKARDKQSSLVVEKSMNNSLDKMLSSSREQSVEAFAKVFNTTPDALDLHVIYDVSHNIVKVGQHMADAKEQMLWVHRKGSTHAFPLHHPLIAVDYQLTGQPVFTGGTMGICSYVLTGAE
ncbi:hypothetical protein STEG23_014376 [Scotinomys teguina]